jgi:hypothetical protein
MKVRSIGNTTWHRAISLTLATIAGIGAIGAHSQPASAQLSDDEALTSSAEERRIRLLEIPDAFERAFFEHDPNYFDNQNFERRLGWFTTNYTENEIERDGHLVNTVYQDLMRQQSLDSPPIRTSDLANPFDSSLNTMPRAGINPPIRGSEFAIPNN